MQIQKTKENDKMTLAVAGRLDTTTAPELEAFLEDLSGVTQLVLDFSELEYVSSAGLRVILKAQKLMNVQGSMTLLHVNADVREVFDITGFSDILTIEA